LKQLKKQHKATGPGTHINICMNSDSNFPKQVLVDFKKFWSVEDFFLFLRPILAAAEIKVQTCVHL
jgi:hypothetical protein